MSTSPILSAGRWFPLAVVVLGIAACGGRTSGFGRSGSNSGSGASTGASIGGSTGAVNGAAGSASGTAMTGAAMSGTAMSGTAMSGTAASGTETVSGSVVSSGVGVTPVGPGPDGGAALGALPSAGCGKPWNGMTGMWVSQPTGCDPGSDNQGTASCQAIPPGSVVPAKASQGSPEYRGWWVYVPNGYDPSKPYTVIYSGAGCGDGNYFNAGRDGYPYYNVDGNQAILVGLDYDTYSDVPGCYDNRDPQSNDFTFFPWLQSQIDNELCIDTNHEFFSGYSSGAWVAQQLNCAFPDKLRGSVVFSGCEPGVAPYPGAQFSPCAQKPTAAFYVHDPGDTDNAYACILPACTRVLKQNGCSVTKCDPLDKTLTTPYPVPRGVTLPPGGSCVQFNGCPEEYPVIFCLTPNQDESDGQSWGIVPLFWDWMSNKLAANDALLAMSSSDASTGISSCIDGGDVVCGDACVNEQTDPSHCGACDNSCPGSAPFCRSGVCSPN